MFEERRGLVLSRVIELAVSGKHREIAILFVDKAQAERALNYLARNLEAQRNDTKDTLLWLDGDVTIHFLVHDHEQSWPPLRQCPGFIFSDVDAVSSRFIDDTKSPLDALQVATVI
jgi:hypothetical protein